MGSRGRTVEPFEERLRAQEEVWLSPLAVRSYETRGRERDEAPCSVRTPFQRDRDRLVHSKPFRRLKGKTQVFIDPEGDHYRTRMTHTLEITAISRVVATRISSRRSASATTRVTRRSGTQASRRSTTRSTRRSAGGSVTMSSRS